MLRHINPFIFVSCAIGLTAGLVGHSWRSPLVVAAACALVTTLSAIAQIGASNLGLHWGLLLGPIHVFGLYLTWTFLAYGVGRLARRIFVGRSSALPKSGPAP